MDMGTIAVFVATQAVTAIATVSVLKNDMTWLKSALQDHEKRLRSVERANSL